MCVLKLEARGLLNPMYCKATNRAGKPCRAQAISGATVCRLHGGSTPQVREAARRRILSLVDPALGVLAQAVRKRNVQGWEPSPTEISAAREILNRAGLTEAPPEAPQDGATWEEFVMIYRRSTTGGGE